MAERKSFDEEKSRFEEERRRLTEEREKMREEIHLLRRRNERLEDLLHIHQFLQTYSEEKKMRKKSRSRTNSSVDDPRGRDGGGTEGC